MSMLMMLMVGFLSARATLDKSGHLMLVEYSINEPTKDEGVVYVDILFHYKGETYRVARHRYSEPVTSIVDTFPWFSKDKWEGGDLEVVARRADGSLERSYISEKLIEVRDLGYEPPEFEHEVNSALVKPDDGPDPYAWRMLGYDPGHTGYYPFSLYPPLDSLWMYDWSGAGTWTTEISGCAGYDMLFIPLAPWGWNRIAAFDVERGDTLWERVATANVWTSALSLDDSTLFVGTSIGFTPWQDTTFYALDPFTGELKWVKALKTVEYSPIVVDTFVYAPHFYRVYCFTYGGDSVWVADGAFSSPVYEDGVIVGAARDSVLNARDYLTGGLIWDFTRNGWIFTLMAYEEKVIFSPSLFDQLYALNVVNGNIVWTSFPIANLRTGAAYTKVWYAHGQYINDTLKTRWVVLDSNTGLFELDTILTSADTNSGRTGFPLTSSDSIFWITNCSRIYIFKNHIPLYVTDLPESPAIWPSWNFPIFYKNYFIYAHEDFLIAYRGKTYNFEDSIPSSDSASILYSPDGHIVFHFVAQKSSPFSLSLYTVDGRKVWELHEPFLPAGIHSLNLPESPHSGVYILKYSFSNLTGTERFIYIKRR